MSENFTKGRRTVISKVSALLVVSSSGLAQGQSNRRFTPSQTEGPYYPVKEPKDADFDLLTNGDRRYGKGLACWIEGIVTDDKGQPLKGGVMEIWQCDENGHYDHPGDGSKIDSAFQGFGRTQLNDRGEFRFRTIKPSAYVGRTPHIHAKVFLASRELLTTQLYVSDDPGNVKDPIWRRMSEPDRALVTAPYVAVADGFRARYNLVVRI
jgi:protocatechuate 3,4-dioxygenase, beta subunit